MGHKEPDPFPRIVGGSTVGSDRGARRLRRGDVAERRHGVGRREWDGSLGTEVLHTRRKSDVTGLCGGVTGVQ